MITKEQALNIANQLIPDLQIRNYKISDKKPFKSISINLPEDCWYIIYSNVPANYSACSSVKNYYLCIDKLTGKIKQ